MQVNGRLPCYADGLRKNPALQGRVTTRFTIDQTGSVSAAQDGGSDLPDQDVVQCVVRAYGNMSYPQSSRPSCSARRRDEHV